MGLEDRLMPFEYYQLHLNNNLPCLERTAGPLQVYRRFFFKGYSKTLLKMRIGIHSAAGGTPLKGFEQPEAGQSLTCL